MSRSSKLSMSLFLALSAHAATELKEVKTASGIGITILKEGKGDSPKATDMVKVHYRGTLGPKAFKP